MKIKIGQINFSVIIVFIIMNAILLITREKATALIDWLVYLGPFIVGLVILKITYKSNKIKTDAFLFACMGLFITLLGEAGNTTGIIFLCFSVYIFNSEKSLLIVLGLTIISIVIKQLVLKLTPMGTVNIFLMYSYVGACYYVLFHPKKIKIEPNNKIDEVTTEIIELMLQGFNPKRIQQKMSITITVDAVRKRVQRVQKQFYCNNESQLIIELIKKGLLCPKLDN